MAVYPVDLGHLGESNGLVSLSAGFSGDPLPKVILLS